MENQGKENQNLVPMAEDLSIVEQIARVAHNLESAEVIDVDLASDYWTPTAPLESKKLIFMGIQERLVDDIASPGTQKLLPTAFFVEKTKQGDKETLRRVCNASKKLLGVIADANIQAGTPLLVTYLGKVKNKTNQFSSDSWSVKPIKI
ncbi:hypothetical protein [Raineya sp.]